ncbi:YqiA/YcfP family alpha/beta fold hydrolase [Ornithobacterium rhinotracheale]|uniref:YqiA/YcfP family alpha/beta fold hydrolase n=1 Tax=Ornithobacterium rhinotracheale TaxID=28251 RepID=UPI001FF67728|nr:YqiA/YcfP family alpha/beta fold hydrolase [Ornithobacterium rhinotracheale]MCK0204485.1 alpha/beta hydrolase [Ornithobacterium rhinotracheale]
MKTLLYLHGLNSCLHDDRREALQSYDVEILAPSIDYEGTPDLLNIFVEKYKSVDLIVGSSAGGLLGYYLSGILQIPAILFNPALPFAKNYIDLPKLAPREKFLQVVIGAQDKVVPPLESFKILNSDDLKNAPMEIHWRNRMEHSLPIDIFTEEIAYFFNKI